MPAPLLSVPSWVPAFSLEWVLLALFAAIIAIDAMRSGTRKAASFCIAAPLALLLYGYLQGAAFIPLVLSYLPAPAGEVAAFAMIFIVLCLCIYKTVPAELGGSAFPMQSVLAAAAAVVVLLAVWVQVPALLSVWSPSAWIPDLFAPAYRLYWFIGAYIALAFSR